MFTLLSFFWQSRGPVILRVWEYGPENCTLSIYRLEFFGIWPSLSTDLSQIHSKSLLFLKIGKDLNPDLSYRFIRFWPNLLTDLGQTHYKSWDSTPPYKDLDVYSAYLRLLALFFTEWAGSFWFLILPETLGSDPFGDVVLPGSRSLPSKDHGDYYEPSATNDWGDPATKISQLFSFFSYKTLPLPLFIYPPLLIEVKV